MKFNGLMLLVIFSICVFSTASQASDEEDPPNEPCPRSYIAGRVGMCTRKLTKATQRRYHGQVCRLQQKFIQCMERLTRKCNISPQFEKNLVTPIRDANRKLCQPNVEDIWFGGN